MGIFSGASVNEFKQVIYSCPFFLSQQIICTTVDQALQTVRCKSCHLTEVSTFFTNLLTGAVEYGDRILVAE